MVPSEAKGFSGIRRLRLLGKPLAVLHQYGSKNFPQKQKLGFLRAIHLHESVAIAALRAQPPPPIRHGPLRGQAGYGQGGKAGEALALLYAVFAYTAGASRHG
jgi:hypothetical protein